ncbi:MULTISPECIES: hypothetical protein [Paraburkholderia]|uniref:hypothetical protein n=1 Tax=Paraburkholderia TaxID=1822464 RepID=UPI0022554F1C|nr:MULTISPECIES: hypothetical protein [Paraburkholderia]MCX4176708.1 hypothetical protein [Paraburkholderia madseniana]MDQ6464699.1 hypothetical protein [Paraburkholderia madseniana]
MDIVPRLEVHYYLQDDSHSIDAVVRNRCEAEFLAAVSYITQALGIELRFEATVPVEGGFRDIWRIVVGKASHPLVGTVLIPLLSLVLTQTVNIWNAPPKPNPELEKQQLEINRLNIEHWKLENRLSQLEIQKRERESALVSKPSAKPQAGTAATTAVPASPPMPVPERSSSAVNDSNPVVSTNGGGNTLQLQSDLKVVTRRSNFYKHLLAYERVTAVGFRAIPVGGPAPDEVITERSQFTAFIMQSNVLEPDVSDALIEIVSPVISEGDMKWKGRRSGEVITFAMNDRAFKQQVFRSEVSFQHGDSIRCVLETDRKLDEAGNEKVTGYRVTTVLDKIDGSGKVHETSQGRRKRFADKQPADGQADMFGTKDA